MSIHIYTVKTIQYTIVGIDNDAIPICNPQTSSITGEQRVLIHTLKTSSPSDALNIIRNNRSTIESLFKILDQSLRMTVNLFDKYGSIDEESDTESSDDAYSGNTDESGDETQDENTIRDGSSYMITDEITNDSMVDMPESGSDTTVYSTEDDRNS